jgi:hypothetical protein
VSLVGLRRGRHELVHAAGRGFDLGPGGQAEALEPRERGHPEIASLLPQCVLQELGVGVEDTGADLGQRQRLGLGQLGVTRACTADTRFCFGQLGDETVEITGQGLDPFRSSGRHGPRPCHGGGVQMPAQRALLGQKLRCDASADVEVALAEELEQAPRPRPLADLEGRCVMTTHRQGLVPAHADVDQQLVDGLVQLQRGGARARARHTCPGRVQRTERRFGKGRGWLQVASIPTQAGQSELGAHAHQGARARSGGQGCLVRLSCGLCLVQAAVDLAQSTLRGPFTQRIGPRSIGGERGLRGLQGVLWVSLLEQQTGEAEVGVAFLDAVADRLVDAQSLHMGRARPGEIAQAGVSDRHPANGPGSDDLRSSHLLVAVHGGASEGRECGAELLQRQLRVADAQVDVSERVERRCLGAPVARRAENAQCRVQMVQGCLRLRGQAVEVPQAAQRQRRVLLTAGRAVQQEGPLEIHLRFVELPQGPLCRRQAVTKPSLRPLVPQLQCRGERTLVRFGGLSRLVESLPVGERDHVFGPHLHAAVADRFPGGHRLPESVEPGPHVAGEGAVTFAGRPDRPHPQQIAGVRFPNRLHPQHVAARWHREIGFQGQLVHARPGGHHRQRIRSDEATRAVRLQDHGAVRPGQLLKYVRAVLLDHELQVLPGPQLDRVRVRVAFCRLALDHRPHGERRRLAGGR